MKAHEEVHLAVIGGYILTRILFMCQTDTTNQTVAMQQCIVGSNGFRDDSLYST